MRTYLSACVIGVREPKAAPHLRPPELVPLLRHTPVGVAHHGDEQVEQQDVGHHGEGAVQHVDDGWRVEGVVHRQVDEAHTQLKLGEQRDREGAVRGDGLRVLGHVHHPQGCHGNQTTDRRTEGGLVRGNVFRWMAVPRVYTQKGGFINTNVQLWNVWTQ